MMLRLDEPQNQPAQSRPEPMEMRLPFVQQQGIGLGDAVARLTQAFGVPACQPCKQRQQMLNDRLRLMPW